MKDKLIAFGIVLSSIIILPMFYIVDTSADLSGMGGTTDSALKAYYQLESTGNDYLGGHNLTANGGPTHAAGKFNNAASFDKTATQSFTASSTLGISSLANPITISIWFKPNSQPPDMNNAFGLISLGKASEHVDFDLAYGNYTAGEASGNECYPYYCIKIRRQRQNVANDDAIITGQLTTGVWYHIALVYDGANIRGYLNGVVSADKASTGNGSSGISDNFAIGVFANEGQNLPTDGMIDDVAIFTRALGEYEIKSIYNSKQVWATPAYKVYRVNGL